MRNDMRSMKPYSYFLLDENIRSSVAGMIKGIIHYITSSDEDPPLTDESRKTIKGLAQAIVLMLRELKKQEETIKAALADFRRLVAPSEHVPETVISCFRRPHFEDHKFKYLRAVPDNVSNEEGLSASELGKKKLQTIKEAKAGMTSFLLVLRIVSVPRVLRRICCITEAEFEALNASAHPTDVFDNETLIRPRLQFCSDSFTRYMLAFRLINTNTGTSRRKLLDFAEVSLFFSSLWFGLTLGIRI